MRLSEASIDILAMVIGSFILIIYLIATAMLGVDTTKDTQKAVSKATLASYGVEE